MVKNVGPEDRVVRIVVGLALGFLVFMGIAEGGLAIIFGVLSAVFLITGILRFCLVYKLLGIDTSIQEQSYSTTDDRSGL